MVERRRAEWNREVLREVLRRWRSCAPGPAGLDGLTVRGSVPILCIHYGYASSFRGPWLTPDAGQLAWAGVDLLTGFDLSRVFDGATG